jgi:DNA-binding NtrC family response regulator
VHARIIVASNWDLQEMADIAPPDLYYRLNVMSFHAAGARSAWEDIDHWRAHGRSLQHQVPQRIV